MKRYQRANRTRGQTDSHARQAREATIQKIKDERAENKPDSGVKKITGRIGIDACSSAPSRILSVAVNPQNRFPAVIKLGRR